MVALISAEGETALGLTAQAIDRICAALGWTDRMQVARIADLGSGPGVDACALAAAFPAATVVAVDNSPAMLAAATSRAEVAGIVDRFESVVLGLDGDLTSLTTVDLVWSALTLHHIPDATAALKRMATRVRPGGALCVLDRHTPLEARPGDDLDRPGLWNRVTDAQATWYAHARASHHSHSSLSELAHTVAAAGLKVVHTDTLKSTTTLPASPDCERLAARHVHMVLRNFRDELEPADAAALEASSTPARLSRSAVTFTATRLLVVATRQPA
jgi:ubiquinone/menaquinone biosynthesis C-methylase UbiE